MEAPSGYTQTFVVRVSGGSPLERVIAALNELTEERMLRVTDLRVLARDLDGAVATIRVEHLWWSRMMRALSEASAELISELELPRAGEPIGPSASQLRQIEELNELRRVGTLTEAEFATAKRSLLSLPGRGA